MQEKDIYIGVPLLVILISILLLWMIISFYITRLTRHIFNMNEEPASSWNMLWLPCGRSQIREYVLMVNTCEHERGYSCFAATKPSVSNLATWGICQVSPSDSSEVQFAWWMHPSHHVPKTILLCQLPQRLIPSEGKHTSTSKCVLPTAVLRGIEDIELQILCQDTDFRMIRGSCRWLPQVNLIWVGAFNSLIPDSQITSRYDKYSHARL